MKKSPFSTPRGNAGRQGLWNSGGSPGRGYGRPKSYEFHSPNNSQTSQSGGEDFIPFDNTPPPAQRKSGEWQQSPRGQWQGGSGGGGGGRGNRRQSSSPGYNSYRDNRARDNNHQHHQQQPYFKDAGRQFYRQRKNFHQRGNARTKPDISQYVNLKWFLEDPWSELTRKSANASRNESSSDLSFSNATIGDVSLDDSATNPRSRETESEGSLVRTSEELAETSGDGSRDPKISQDSND